MQLISFLSTLYDGAGDDETWCFGHQKPGARMDHTFLSASALDDAQALVDGLTLQGQHVWLRSATGGQKASEAQRQYIVSLDVDLAGPGHKGGNNPPDATPIDEALVALSIVRPTFVVRTGGGFLYVWKLAEPQTPDPALCKALQAAVRKEIAPYSLDSTSDVVRLIRVPGGRNFKEAYGPNHPTVEIVEENAENTLTSAQLKALAPPVPPRSKRPRAIPGGDTPEDGTPASESILAGCARLRFAAEHPETQTEPQWACAAAVFAACDDLEGFLEFSQGHPGFDETTAREKYARALEAGMGVTYARITAAFGPDLDDPFEHGGVHSPLTLGFKPPAFISVAMDWAYMVTERAYYRLHDQYRLEHRAFDDMVKGVPGIGRPLHEELRRWHAAPKVERIEHLPGQPRFPHPGVLNSWTAGGVEPDEGDWSAIEALIENQFPVAAERERIFDYLAFHLQFPAVKIRHALLVRGRPGTGKGLLFNKVLPKLVGHENHRSVRGDALSGRWTAELIDCESLFVDEVRQPDGYDAANRVKDIITEDRVSAEQKFAALRTGTTPRMVTLASNYVAPLPIEPGDRRYSVTGFARQKLAADVADRLVADLESQCAAFSHWLRSRVVDDFDPNARPPETQDKLDIIRQTRPSVEAVLDDAIHGQEGPFAHDLVTPERVRQWLFGAGLATTPKAIANALSALGAQRLGGLQVGDAPLEGRSVVWAIRNIDFWRTRKSKDWGRYLSDELDPQIAALLLTIGQLTPVQQKSRGYGEDVALQADV